MCQDWLQSTVQLPLAICVKYNVVSLRFFKFFFLISCFSDSRTARTKRRWKMCNGSNDADITKEVPFVGFMCMKIHLGVEIYQNVDPPSNVAITCMLICNARLRLNSHTEWRTPKLLAIQYFCSNKLYIYFNIAVDNTINVSCLLYK